MKRMPIIVPGQVYLHRDLNEYLVVTKATCGDIQFKGIGFGGMNEVDLFLDRFSPVDPTDLAADEAKSLLELVPQVSSLSTGWILDDEGTGEHDEDLE